MVVVVVVVVVVVAPKRPLQLGVVLPEAGHQVEDGHQGKGAGEAERLRQGVPHQEEEGKVHQQHRQQQQQQQQQIANTYQ